MAKDPYSILGVSRSATEAEIKAAYRKLSRELHPDKHKGDKEKESKFKEVNAAYEVLSDPKKKQAFDQFGSADGSSPFGGGGSGFSGFGNGFDASSFGGFSDIFESFFSGGGGGGNRRAQEGTGRDTEVELSIPFMATVTGEERPISFRTLITCDTCKGSGAAEGSKVVTCDQCSGTGQVTKRMSSLFGVIQQSVVCSKCKGAGKIPEKPCRTCSGEGRVADKKTVQIHIPAGISDGQALRITGEGEAGKHGARAGDLFVRIRVQPDGRFERHGDDIRSTLSLSALDAILGTEKIIETVHGSMTLNIPAGTQPDQILRIRSKGMPVLNTTRFGDHYVTVSIVIPSKLSRKERELLEEWRKMAT